MAGLSEPHNAIWNLEEPVAIHIRSAAPALRLPPACQPNP